MSLSNLQILKDKKTWHTAIHGIFMGQEYWSGVPWPSPHGPSRQVQIFNKPMYGTSPHCYHSVTQSCLAPFDLMDCSTPVLSLSFSITQSLFKPMSIESVMASNHLILYRPLLLLPSIFPSIRVFSNELALHILALWPHQVAKVLELQLQHQSFQ